MEDSLNFMQEDSKLSRSFTISLETSHKTLLKTLVENNYVLAVPPDNQVDDFDKIQEQRLGKISLISSRAYLDQKSIQCRKIHEPQWKALQGERQGE